MAVNRGCSYREQIEPDAARRSVLGHLALAYPHSSHDVWADRVARGEVELNGAGVDATHLLCAGDTLVWHRPPWDEPDVPLHFAVCHVDDAIVAVAKPGGLPTMPAGGFLEHTLLALVRTRFPGASPVHRLGRHTSGLVLFARTTAAAAALGRAWRQQGVVKQYRALASGDPAWNRRTIDAAIGPVPHPRLGSVHGASPTGKRSHSVAVVLERRSGATLMQVHITTGRPHQIRIHLAWAGHPLTGDPLYGVGGVPRESAPGLPGDGGYLLHAERLRFAHPSSGADVDLRVAPPAELTCSVRTCD